MVGKSTIKLIKSLAHKKYRYKENLFLVEGDKIVTELLRSEVKIKEVLISENFNNFNNLPKGNIEKTSFVDATTIKKASLLKSPQNSIAVCRFSSSKHLSKKFKKGLSIFLDGVQDPGNLGTIVRICDWYGIENVYCSHDTVDLYNPKVIQATMGSFLRINFKPCDTSEIVEMARNADTPIFGAFMDGENIYTKELPENALLVMGNEGNGIRPEMEQYIQQRISIPNLSANSSKAESLNVGVAAAILCSEFKRRIL
jgi:TrmH family RNA methyltransferase